jgi:hypothetical protein
MVEGESKKEAGGGWWFGSVSVWGYNVKPMPMLSFTLMIYKTVYDLYPGYDDRGHATMCNLHKESRSHRADLAQRPRLRRLISAGGVGECPSCRIDIYRMNK